MYLMNKDIPTVPSYAEPFFWSYHVGMLDIEVHKTLIITHILNIGSEKAVRWLQDTYTSEEITEVMKASVKTAWDKKSLALWSLVYGVTPKERRFI